MNYSVSNPILAHGGLNMKRVFNETKRNHFVSKRVKLTSLHKVVMKGIRFSFLLKVKEKRLER